MALSTLSLLGRLRVTLRSEWIASNTTLGSDALEVDSLAGAA